MGFTTPRSALHIRYAKKDRRPIDPPPIVRLKLFVVFNSGTPHQYEEEYQNYECVS